jgi:HSP20 family protein
MAHLTLYPKNNVFNRDPFSLARELMGWDPTPARTNRESAFLVRFDVRETEAAYVISADVPGVNDENIDLAIDGNRLTISGKREATETKEGENYHLFERSFGQFSRTFAMPKEADADNISADLKNGVLTVTIGKREQAKPRKISIKNG